MFVSYYYKFLDHWTQKINFVKLINKTILSFSSSGSCRYTCYTKNMLSDMVLLYKLSDNKEHFLPHFGLIDFLIKENNQAVISGRLPASVSSLRGLPGIYKHKNQTLQIKSDKARDFFEFAVMPVYPKFNFLLRKYFKARDK